MKLQYLHDGHDLMKWDVALNLLRTGAFKRFANIPLLTADDGTAEGNTRRPMGMFDADLYAFQQECLRGIEAGTRQRDLADLRAFWRGAVPDVEYRPHRDQGPLFTHAGREDYFTAVPDSSLEDALVFLDPDIGLEAKTMRRKRVDRREYYLLWKDVAGLGRRCSERSTLLVYQHLPRNKKHVAAHIARKATSLFAVTGWDRAVHLTDGLVAFLALARDPEVASTVEDVFRDYADRHAWGERRTARHVAPFAVHAHDGDVQKLSNCRGRRAVSIHRPSGSRVRFDRMALPIRND